MGRWLASLCPEEKNTQKPLDRTDETDKTLSLGGFVGFVSAVSWHF